jgi:hypothetical protein
MVFRRNVRPLALMRQRITLISQAEKDAEKQSVTLGEGD